MIYGYGLKRMLYTDIASQIILILKEKCSFLPQTIVPVLRASSGSLIFKKKHQINN